MSFCQSPLFLPLGYGLTIWFIRLEKRRAVTRNTIPFALIVTYFPDNLLLVLATSSATQVAEVAKEQGGVKPCRPLLRCIRDIAIGRIANPKCSGFTCLRNGRSS